MSHLNILKISKEIEHINKNIESLKHNIQDVNIMNDQLTNTLQDLNEIKSNKTDTMIILEQLRDDFKFLETKLTQVDRNVKQIASRDLDYVNKNTNYFNHFLTTQANLDSKKINILLHVFECHTPQQFFLINEQELIEFGFTYKEISTINKKCKEELEISV